MEYVKGEEGRKDTISKLSTLLTKSTVAQEVSSSTDRVTQSVSFRLMRRGKVLTSTELLCVCGCLKQNQLQNCHTPSASLESSRDLQTFMDREAIKIDNKDSSSNIKQEVE